MKNILNKFTLRSLKLNIKRTIATCMGIIMSTALICAVAGVASSFQQTLINHTIELDGDYHAVFFDISKNDQKYIFENRNVKSTYITQGIGYSELKESKNDYKPYMYLMAFDKDALNNFGLRVTEGRLPQNSKEVVISKHMEENGGVSLYKVGDKIILNIGKRVADDGSELTQNNVYNNPKNSSDTDYVEEHLTNTKAEEFTVVGIIERPNIEIEPYSAPGYSVITLLDDSNMNANNPIDILVKFKNIKETYDDTKEISKQLSQGSSSVNSELLRWSGVARNEGTLQMMYGLVGIVMGIIVVSSVFVIRNSFEISITEKMKQYGMLSSIGATKKQIKKNVLFEGMILGLISIPIGIACGALATEILMQVSTILVGKTMFTNEVKFVFNLPLLAIALSAGLGFLTIYFSCVFSARKAAKISPIAAIRSSNDIKIKAKKMKCPKIINKIFGIGGEIAYKNLRRNKKKYRTTVISLVVSITVFISLNTFLNYAFGITGTYYQEMNYNVSIFASCKGDSFESEKQEYKYYQKFVKENNISKYSIVRTATLEKSNIDNYYTDEYKKYYLNDEMKENENKPSVILMSIGDNAYKEYIKKIGGKYENYKDSIIYYDNSAIYIANNGEDTKKIVPLNISANDIIEGIPFKYNEEKTEKTTLKIEKVADRDNPLESGNFTSIGTFLISDELMDKFEYNCARLQVDVKNDEELCKKIDEEKSELAKTGMSVSYTNYKEEADYQNKTVLLISIFLYGFITVITLIGVTNIFNTITTNMNLRSKEFAMLKSIGMTKKEFNRMINLESIFYGVKSLIIGIVLGTGISYWIYRISAGSDVTSKLKFIFPTKPVIISIVFIAIIVGIIMKYSLNKINKQNIIETIRNDNI